MTNKKQKDINPKDAANETLDKSKDKFDAVLVIGVNNTGDFDVLTNMSSFPHMQWLLNKATLELLLVERNRDKEVPTEAPATE